MIIGSAGREIKLLIGYFKGTFCIAYRSYYKGPFLIQRKCFPRFYIQQKQKWQLHNYCLSLADEN